MYLLGWKYSSGFVSAKMIAKHLYPPANDTFVVMCGPPPMVKQNYLLLKNRILIILMFFRFIFLVSQI